MFFVLLLLLLDKHSEHTSKALTTTDQANIWTTTGKTTTTISYTICGHGTKVEKSGKRGSSGGGFEGFSFSFVFISLRFSFGLVLVLLLPFMK